MGAQSSSRRKCFVPARAARLAAARRRGCVGVRHDVRRQRRSARRAGGRDGAGRSGRYRRRRGGRRACDAGARRSKSVSSADEPHRLVVLDDGTRDRHAGMRRAGRGGRWPSAESHRRASRRASSPIRADGASTELFVQVHAPLPSIIIVGATDVAVALVQLAEPLGFHTTVIDGRDRWANRDRFPTADTLHVGNAVRAHCRRSARRRPLRSCSCRTISSTTFPCSRSRCERASGISACWEASVARRRDREALTRLGATEEDIARVRIPVGLDIGARTPAEIALSVLAELVALRSGRGAARSGVMHADSSRDRDSAHAADLTGRVLCHELRLGRRPRRDRERPGARRRRRAARAMACRGPSCTCSRWMTAMCTRTTRATGSRASWRATA